jgi:hypothetical protein
MMAKSTMRGNREVKKPKQPKKVVAPAVGASTITPKAASVSASAKKK